jgi:hypothetical protein
MDRNQPERRMALRTLAPGAVGAGLAFAVGALAHGTGTGVSALLGVTVVAASFALYVLALGAARAASPAAVQLVAMFGWLLRLGAIVGLLFGLDRVAWFDPLAFGLAAIGGALMVAIYEARLWLADARVPATGQHAERANPVGSDS